MSKFALLNPKNHPAFAFAENVIVAENINDAQNMAELVIDVTDLPVGPGDKYILSTGEWIYKNPPAKDEDNA